MIEGRLSRRYGKALFELALEQLKFAGLKKLLSGANEFVQTRIT